jgi:hypothetical protein
MARSTSSSFRDRRFGEVLATTAAVSLVLLAWAVRELLQLR